MKKFLMYGLVVMILGTVFVTPVSYAQNSAGPVLTQTLSLGSVGNEVSLLQQFLKDKGYFLYKTITTRFGLKTKSAVIAFQKDNTLTPDGIVGPITRAKIAELPAIKKEVASGTSSTTTWSQSRRYGGNIVIPDTTAPTVSVTAPANSDTVSGSAVTVSADASDDTAVVGVQFKIDGSNVGSEDVTAPYAIEWDSTGVLDGTYSVSAVARDTAGNSTESAAIAISVSNSVALVVNKAGAGSGTVTSVPAGISCGATCSASYGSGTTITLTASAAVGSNFAGWSGGGCAGTGTCTVTLSSATSVTATFNLITYALTVSKAGGGSGTVTSVPVGIDCGATCSALFSNGTVVALTPSAQVGSSFVSWSGACSGPGACNITMTAASSVTATFDPL